MNFLVKNNQQIKKNLQQKPVVLTPSEIKFIKEFCTDNDQQLLEHENLICWFEKKVNN